MYNIPLLIVLAFLFVTLIVGLCVSQKATTFREYAVGNKNFYTSTLVVTVLSTIFGEGVLIREIPNLYNDGLFYILLICLAAIKYYIMSVLALHMGPFMQNISMAETIGRIYGNHIRILTALLATGCSIGGVSIQINLMSYTIGMCMDTMDTYIVTVLATLTIIFYSVFGGIRSITITNLFQLLTFIIFIPVLIDFLLKKTDKSFLEVVKFIQKQGKFQQQNLVQFNRKTLSNILNILGSLFYWSPSVIQCFYMSSGPIQSKKTFSRIMIFYPIIWIGIFFIALFVFVGDQTLPKKEVWTYILSDMSPIYKGFIAIAILTMTMSTADSCLHTSSVLIRYDIIESIRNTQGEPYVQQILMAKFTTLVTGVLAMILTVHYPDLFELSTFVLESIMGYFFVTIIPLFILTVFGFRSTTLTALIGITIGTLFMVVWNHWVKPNMEIDGKFIAMIANSLAAISAHYLLPRPSGTGWMEPDPEQKRMMDLIQAFKKYRKNIDSE